MGTENLRSRLTAEPVDDLASVKTQAPKGRTSLAQRVSAGSAVRSQTPVRDGQHRTTPFRICRRGVESSYAVSRSCEEESSATGIHQRRSRLSQTAHGEASPIALKLVTGETLRGWIEYYDRNMLRLTRDGKPNLFIFKHQIAYLAEESVGAHSPRPKAGNACFSYLCKNSSACTTNSGYASAPSSCRSSPCRSPSVTHDREENGSAPSSGRSHRENESE